MPRLFFGLEIPGATKAELLRVKTGLSGARWQQANQLHLTLAFLGEVEASRVPDAQSLAREVRHSPFDLRVQGLGCFGRPEKPKILWAGVTPETELRDLQQSLATQLTHHRFALKNPSFKPHITLSRFQANSGSVAALLDQHPDTPFGCLAVHEFALFESRPGPQGSVYTVLERYSLTG
ncbi:RNA 2',3'-cyclic phosphodiesterase [Marinobacter daepoensis]|uniref:RNA 2',3'-cyclic phosphodiesterase n=1 Tax=Marinobacter daepoensis TaxID=262077 RepID=UPI001C938FBF|nr:RNA 2',3'-cyclic phosphodiesterase [Marinobacter daepoensis]MBY6034395.1 RNA 2',3'-cyclic phosphodiesterase [Marinobacter daepoensis]